jgi:hypothetical protein
MCAAAFVVLDKVEADASRRDSQRAAAQLVDPKRFELCETKPTADSRRECILTEVNKSRMEEMSASDLDAQHDMAAYTRGVLWFSALSFLASAVAAGGLVWTFWETRTMTKAQQRAYLQLGRASVHLDRTYGLRYSLQVRNDGQTPATEITANLSLMLTEPDPADAKSEKIEVHLVAAFIDELPAKSRSDLASDFMHDILDLPVGLLSTAGSHYQKTGTRIGTGEPDEDGRESKIEVFGSVTYRDVFGDKHTLNVRQYSLSLETDGWGLRGSGFRSAQVDE